MDISQAAVTHFFVGILEYLLDLKHLLLVEAFLLLHHVRLVQVDVVDEEAGAALLSNYEEIVGLGDVRQTNYHLLVF
jgi:hypothetical protein